MKFSKLHGAGNDYIYVDARVIDKNWAQLARTISDRHYGVGADGLILAQESDCADLQMKMFNADGSEGLMCGNGIRSLVRFAIDNGMVPLGTTEITIETATGCLEVKPVFRNGRMVRAVVSMGEPKFLVGQVPVRVSDSNSHMEVPLEVNGGIYDISCLSMGNPHAVCFIDMPIEDVDLEQIGPLVENHTIFPEKVNFEIANIIDSTNISMRVWERGSGITMACGTGACAAMVIARTRSLVADEVTVHLPGGKLEIKWTGRGDVIMEGPVEHVFDGEWPD